MKPTIPSGRPNTTKKAASRDAALGQNSGAADRNRTGDLLITNQLLYRLSYSSEGAHSKAKVRIAQLRRKMRTEKEADARAVRPTRPRNFSAHPHTVVIAPGSRQPVTMKTHAGFTLVELMITIAVLAILLGIAVPSMQDMILRNQITSSTNLLVSSATFARSEAVLRGLPVMVCNSSNPNDAVPICSSGSSWADGWIVFVDNNGSNTRDAGEELLRTFPALPTTVKFAPKADNERGVSFNRSGQASGVKSGNVVSAGAVFTICSDGVAEGRETTLGATGRASTVRKACP